MAIKVNQWIWEIRGHISQVLGPAQILRARISIKVVKVVHSRMTFSRHHSKILKYKQPVVYMIISKRP